MTNPIQVDVDSRFRRAAALDPTFFRRTKLRRLRPRNLRLSALLAGLLAALMLAPDGLVAPKAASAATGDIGTEGPSHSGTGTPTGTKRSTSGLWFHDGIWWGNLWHTASADFHIFRFNPATNSWVDTGVTTETRASTHHDVLWDGKTLHVASYRFVNDGLPAEPNYPTTMRRYSYDPVKKTYVLLAQSPTNINNYRVEALTIDKDSTGRVWATWQQGNRIYLNVTATDGKTWGVPFAHPHALSNVSVDDTSALISFGGRMGLMWSRQVGDATDGMYWSSHTDGASNTAWSTPVAAVKGPRRGDDHMNLKWLDASGGRIFAAIKTSLTSASDPLIQLLALQGTTWSAHTIATVAECPNRVIVLIDESTQRLRTFATYPKPSGTTNAGVCTTSGGAIYEKSTDLNTISFTPKTAHIVDADQYVHNVTSTKQNLNSTAWGTANSGLLLLADVNATSRYWHSYEPSNGTAPRDTTAPTVTATSPTADAPAAVTANVTGTFSEPMKDSTITAGRFTLRTGTTTGTGTPVSGAVAYDSATRTATLNPGADLAPGTTYTATIKGGPDGVQDLAGNTLAADRTWSFTTASPGTSETVTLTATADSYVAGGTAANTNYGTGTVLSVDSSPVEATYLKFDLSAYAGRTLEKAVLQLRSAGNGSGGTQNIKLVADDSWTEGGITYNNRPALGTSIGTLGPTTTNTSYNVPLTPGALGAELGGQLSLGIDTSNSDGLDLNSREAGSTAAPKLVLTVSGGDTTPPTVTGTSPAANATGVAVTANVTAAFSEAMNPAYVSWESFTLKEEGATTNLPAVVTYNSTDKVATLDPGADLAAGRTYTATIKGGPGWMRDAAGNALASDTTWNFTTASAGSVDTTAPIVTGTSPATAGTVTSTIPVGSVPYGVAFTPDGSKAYVTDGKTVSVITVASGTVTSTIPVESSSGVAFTPDGSKAYVTNAGSDTVSVISVASGAVTSTIPVGQRPKGVAFTPDGSKAYVVNAGSSTVSVITVASGTVAASIPVGPEPQNVAFTPDGSKAYVTNIDSDTVSVITVASGTVTATIPVGPGPYSVAFTPDGSKAYVTNGSTVSVITVASGTVTSTIQVGSTAYGVAFTPDGSKAYVTTTGSDAVSVITVASGTVTSTIPVGPDPYGVAFTPDGSTAYVTNTGGNTVSGSNTVSVINVGPAAVTANVTGTFSEPMNASTITPDTFTLRTGTTTGTGTPVSAAVAYNSTTRTATLNPGTDLAPGTAYTATIKGGNSGVKDAAGNALAADKTWSFTTASAAPGDTTAPTVEGTSPAVNATGVAVTANVTGTFSEAMDTSTITPGTFTLTAGSTTVMAAVAYDSATRTATLNPGADLAAGTVYTATIKGGNSGVKDVAGNALAADKTWSFTTAPAGGTTSETVTLTATADSYVAGGAPGTNYGTGTVLSVDNSPVETTYLKFDLSAYAGRTLESATLQVRSAWSGSGGTQNVKLVTDDSWTEGGITYNNRPALGTALGRLGPTTTNATYTVPLAAGALAAELGGQLSLGLDTTSYDGLDLNSRETGSTSAPKLVLTLKK